MKSEKLKMPYEKIMVEHSEDFPEGKTIVMNMGDLPGNKANINSKNSGFDIKILMFDVQFETETTFAVVAGLNQINEYPGGLNSLNSNEKKLCFERLLSKGITWDV